MDDTPKTVTIMFQGPDWNFERNPKARHKEIQNGFSLTVLGFDLDYMTLTVYPQVDGEMDINLRIAEVSPYMNEDGMECGDIGWRIEPEQNALRKMPELGPYVGCIFGRVIVSV